jgi:WD40 repeat protein
VSASKDKTLIIWGLGSKRPEVRLEGHSDQVRFCDFSPDGTTILSRSDDLTLKVWRSSGGELATLAGHCNRINACAYSPDGRLVVSGSDDCTMRVWDWARKAEIACLVSPSPIGPTCFGYGGELLAAADQAGRVFILRLKSRHLDRPVVTIGQIYDFHRKDWQDEHTFLCGWCNFRNTAPPAVVSAIEEIERHKGSKTDQYQGTAEELLVDCPHCHRPLKFNPFKAAGRRTSWLSFWRR